MKNRLSDRTIENIYFREISYTWKNAYGEHTMSYDEYHIKLGEMLINSRIKYNNDYNIFHDEDYFVIERMWSLQEESRQLYGFWEL